MKKFFTLSILTLLCCCTGAWATGELNGLFTINASGDKVLFSKGNLQYVDENYQFAEHQYDYFGGNQYSNHVDMFANNDYSSPDGDTAWRILSQSEWSYLYTERSVTNTLSEGARYSKATIGGTYKGVIVFPDSYTHPNGTGFAGNCNNATENYASTVSLEGWALMEAAGCVFLPAAGYNRNGNIRKVDDASVYDSSTAINSESRCTPGFYYDNIYLGDWSYNTTCVPVRLVKDVPASSIPGALSGRFTINASGEKVVFSQGNLQYVGTWQFAENQWDCFSTSQYNDHRDLFGWGTGDAPNKVSNNNGDYGTFTDWGTNAITNGGNTENSGWRTLTKDEWVYLFYSRENAATLFGFGSVNSKNGLIILPDNWTTPEGASFTASTTLGLTDLGSYYHNGKEDNYTHNTYTAEQWAVMESAGAVFLPAAAYRHGADSNIDYIDGGGFYWSSTPFSAAKAYYLNFYYNDLDPQFNEMRYGGRPVRLVRSTNDPEEAYEDIQQDEEGNYLIGSVQNWQDFAEIDDS